MTEEVDTKPKRGRGRPKGAPNKPMMELITERETLTMNADVYEILCQANIVAEESADLAAQGLKVFSDRNRAVRSVLMWVFDPNIKSVLPTGKTPYKQSDAPAPDLADTQLRFETRQFQYFVTEQVSSNRREIMWIQLLEKIPPKEAEMMDLVKDKKWPFKNITDKIVKQAFPDINVA